MGETLTIVRNPMDDDEFERAVAEALDLAQQDPAELERLLRVSYPQAVVRPRGLAEERGVVWYVYREGHWVSGR